MNEVELELDRLSQNWRAADHAKHFKENFSDKSVALLSALLEHYEVLLAMRDLKIQV